MRLETVTNRNAKNTARIAADDVDADLRQHHHRDEAGSAPTTTTPIGRSRSVRAHDSAVARAREIAEAGDERVPDRRQRAAEADEARRRSPRRRRCSRRSSRAPRSASMSLMSFVAGKIGVVSPAPNSLIAGMSTKYDDARRRRTDSRRCAGR